MKPIIVYLKRDTKVKEYTFLGRQGITRGPMRQYSPSRTYIVKDAEKDYWYFRADAMKFKDGLFGYLMSWFKWYDLNGKD